MKKPVNTQKEVKEDPGLFLLEASVLGSSNAIMNQESQGQRSFVNSDTLPGMIENTKAVLERFGVKVLGPVEDDPLFLYVELPEGWKKVPTEHSMWSDLVDDKGRKRAAIFYKAAFYDRSAHISLVPRFSVRLDYERHEKEKVIVADAWDCNKVIFSTDPVPVPSDRHEVYASDRKAEQHAREWLLMRWPDFDKDDAYWED